MAFIPRMAAWAARRFIMFLDSLLRRAYRIREISPTENGLLRIGPGRARQGLTLSDGTVVKPGDLLIELHLWNERLPLRASWPDVRWGIAVLRLLRRSLSLLAEEVQRNPGWSTVSALHGEMVFMDADADVAEQVVRHLGFDWIVPPAPTTFAGRFGRFWQNVYAWWLMWAFNPATLRKKRRQNLARGHAWMSRRTLLARYGPRVAAGASEQSVAEGRT